MMHHQSGLVQMIIWGHPIKQPHSKQMIENQIHDTLTPLIHKLVASLSSPELKSIIIVEVIHHVVAPAVKPSNGIQSLVSGLKLVRIHVLPNLQPIFNQSITI